MSRMNDIAFGDVPDILRKILARLGKIDTRLDGIDTRLNGIEKDVRDTRQVLNVDERLENLQTVRNARSSGGGRSSLPRAAKGQE